MTIPLKDYCAAVAGRYTPDMGDIRAHHTEVPVFVYGDMQYKYSNHAALEGAQRVGLALTVRKYQMFISADSEPMIFREGPHVTDVARVRGEVYLVTLDLLAKLDDSFCNTLHYQRRREHVRWWYREDASRVNRSEFLSWCYLWEGIPSDLGLHLSGKTPYLRPHLKVKLSNPDSDYYQFNFIDDQPNREHVRHATRQVM